jgi:hypothetical protein
MLKIYLFPCRKLSKNPRRAWGPRGWAKSGLRNARGRIRGVSLDDDEWFAWGVQLRCDVARYWLRGGEESPGVG